MVASRRRPEGRALRPKMARAGNPAPQKALSGTPARGVRGRARRSIRPARRRLELLGLGLELGSDLDARVLQLPDRVVGRALEVAQRLAGVLLEVVPLVDRAVHGGVVRGLRLGALLLDLAHQLV